MKPSGFAAALLLASSSLPLCARAEIAHPARFDKVLVVVLENTDYGEALKEPALAGLARGGALLTRFHAEAHPSQPNYVALVSGGTRGVGSDDDASIEGRHLGDLLEAKGRSWKAYLEDYPGGCFAGARAGNYVRKHNPFISFAEVRRSPQACSRLVAAPQLRQDLAAGRLPDFALYIPDLKHDGHDTGAAYAARWLSSELLPLLQPALAQGLLLVVTFDESESHRGENQVFTALYGAGVRPGARSSADYSHYSLLRTIEDRFGVGTLGQADATALAINDVWR